MNKFSSLLCMFKNMSTPEIEKECLCIINGIKNDKMSCYFYII